MTRQHKVSLFIVILLAGLAHGMASHTASTAQPAPTATPVIFVPPTRTPLPPGQPTATQAPTLRPRLNATRLFVPGATPTPAPTVSPRSADSAAEWPWVGRLRIDPARWDGEKYRVRLGMARVGAEAVRGAARVVFFISDNGQPPTILGTDDALDDGASVPWLVLSRQTDALISAVAVSHDGRRLSLPAWPVRVVASVAP